MGGLVSDWMGCRTPTIVAMIVASIGALYGYKGVPADVGLNEVVMTVVGALVGGSYNLIAATVAADLGTQPSLAGNAAALATVRRSHSLPDSIVPIRAFEVTGLIDGSGSLGSGLGQVGIPYIQEIGSNGWSYVFWLFIAAVSSPLSLSYGLTETVDRGRSRSWIGEMDAFQNTLASALLAPHLCHSFRQRASS